MSIVNKMFGAVTNISYKTKGDAWKPIRIDPYSLSVAVIANAHREVHKGTAFYSNYKQTLANGNVLAISLQTADTVLWSHLVLHANGTADASLDIWEDCTSATGGAAQTLRNQNRNLSTVSGNTSTAGGTGSNLITRNGGTNIYSAGLADGAPIDWKREEGEELILKQNSLYVFQITNGVNSNIASLTLRWYETEDNE